MECCGRLSGSCGPGKIRQTEETEIGAYTAEVPFPTPANVPPMTWKIRPLKGHLLAEVLDVNGMPADGARVIILKVGDRATNEVITQYADGDGYRRHRSRSRGVPARDCPAW